jgi:MoxR-like ATPase
MTTASPVAQHIDHFRERFTRVTKEVGRRIVGNETLLANTVTALLAGGHVLLEGIPGVGKTSLVHTLADVLHLKFSRIQFTPDLMPADIVGTNIVQEHAHGGTFFEFQPGPIFANVVLADEINRATPKTQSALLEAMQDHSVSVGKSTYKLEQPFLVLATQNPLEMEGTYPLPEAQLDRFFFKLKVEYPPEAAMHEILDRTTQLQTTEVARVMRAAQALVLAGKIHALQRGNAFVSVDDIRAVALPALRHRLLMNFEGEAEQVDVDTIVSELLATVATE